MSVEVGDSQDVVELPDADTGGLISRLIASVRRERKKDDLEADGYLRWLLVDEEKTTEKWVKPAVANGETPAIEHDGEIYLFPPDGITRDSDGSPSAVHRIGSEMPLAAGDNDEALEADINESDLFRHELDDTFSTAAEVAPDGGYINLKEPDVKGTNPITKVWRLWKHDKDRKKVGKEGYVQWYLVDDTLGEPKYVKPEMKGGGLPEYEYDGETYLFPRESLVPDEKTGMWTAVHHRGDAMPINMRLPGEPSIATDELKEFLQKRVTSTPPSWLSQFDIDASDAMKYLLVGFIGLVLAQELLGGIF